jgi:hypothetical protein
VTAPDDPVGVRQRASLPRLDPVAPPAVTIAYANPSSRIGGFFRSALVIDQRVSRKGLHYRGAFRNALAAILAGYRGTSEYELP